MILESMIRSYLAEVLRHVDAAGTIAARRVVIPGVCEGYGAGWSDAVASMRVALELEPPPVQLLLMPLPTPAALPPSAAIVKTTSAPLPVKAKPAIRRRVNRERVPRPEWSSVVTTVVHKPTLTQTEVEVAVLAATGAENKQIAETLICSVNTVKAHLLHIAQKLGTHSKAELKTWLDTNMPADVVDVEE